VRFQVLTAARVNMTVFSSDALFSVVETDRRFRGMYSLYIRATLAMEEDSISETSVSFNQNTRSNIAEENHTHLSAILQSTAELLLPFNRCRNLQTEM
jgi:hypothetical protein